MRCSEGLASSFGPFSLSSVGATAGPRSRAARELKRQKIATILISHRLTDLFAVCDRVVALRQGRVVSDEPIAQTSMNAVVAHIVGAA